MSIPELSVADTPGGSVKNVQCLRNHFSYAEQNVWCSFRPPAHPYLIQKINKINMFYHYY